jgi:hypothetical protein
MLKITKTSQAISHINSELKLLMTETVKVSETLNFGSKLTQLIA